MKLPRGCSPLFRISVWRACLGISAVLILFGCGSEVAVKEIPNKQVVSPNEIHLTAAQIRLNEITVEQVKEESTTPHVTAIGRIRARAGGEAQVFSPFVGRLIADPEKLPRVGSRVERGEVLAQVEQIFTASERLQVATAITQLKASLQQAQNDVEYRQTQLDRLRSLYEKGALPLKQVQAAELELKQAQSRLEAARRTQAQYQEASVPDAIPRRENIYAPISGTIVAAEVTAGQQTDPARSLLTVVDLSSLWVDVAVQESDLDALRKARTAEVRMRANPGRSYRAHLITVGNVVDPANRTVTATFALPNPDGSLKIGMYAEAEIVTGTPARDLTVPSTALITEEHRSIVFVETGPGTFALRSVVPGNNVGDRVIIQSGLQSGARVVVHGAQSLRGEVSKALIPVEKD